jgi:hypothetical protein
MRKQFGILAFSLFLVAVSALAYFPLLPSPSERPSVPWGMAVQVLYTGQVTRFLQTHHLDVSLWLRNATILTTKEPTIDAIFDEVRKCGDPCRNIAWGTE